MKSGKEAAGASSIIPEMLGGADGRALRSSSVDQPCADLLVCEDLLALSPKIDPNMAQKALGSSANVSHLLRS